MMQIKSTFAFPSTWRNAEVCEVGTIITGNTPSKKDSHNYGNYIPFIKPPQLLNTIVDQGESYLSASGAEKGRIAPPFSILVSCIGNLGKTGINRIPIAFNQQITAIVPYCGIGPLFLFYQTQSGLFRQQLEEFSSATTIPIINKGNFERLILQIAPLNEQRRIVTKIEELFSELDKGIESLKAARAKLNIYHQAVLKHAFEGKLTAQWREENKDKLETPEQLLARIKQQREARYEQQLQEWKAAVKKWEEGGKSGKRPARSRMPKPVSTIAEEEIAHLESLPSGWLQLTAESVGIVQLGRQRSPKNRSRDYPTKYIRAANITEQGLDLDDVLDMDFLPHELSAYRLEKGDLVLSEASGSAAQVGKPAIWDDQIPNCCFQNTVIRHQPYCRDYAVYLLWLYRFFYVSGKFAQVAGGVGINHLSAFKFAQIALPLCSLAEQQEIVRLLEERFAAIEQQEREIDSALNQAEMLRQSILKKAFSGQLIPQDPHDEPASILLERIKAEKAARSQNNTRAKRRGTTATA